MYYKELETVKGAQTAHDNNQKRNAADRLANLAKKKKKEKKND